MNYLTKILIAEDDTNLRDGLHDAFELEGYTVKSVENGQEALTAYAAWEPDMLILDVMMPLKSGYDVCRDVRRLDRVIPIIMLTAKGEEIDKVIGLELGADDYVTKPFGLRELMARVGAILRRAKLTADDDCEMCSDCLEFDAIKIDLGLMKGKNDGLVFELSKREVELLKFFNKHAGQVLERNKILSAVWGASYGGMTRTLDQHIAQLRKKLEADPKTPVYIQTVYGIGYRFEV